MPVTHEVASSSLVVPAIKKESIKDSFCLLFEAKNCTLLADLKQIFDSLSEIPFTTESIEYIHTKYNRFRQIVQLINQLEIYAKDNGITEYTLETIRGLL